MLFLLIVFLTVYLVQSSQQMRFGIFFAILELNIHVHVYISSIKLLNVHFLDT